MNINITEQIPRVRVEDIPVGRAFTDGTKRDVFVLVSRIEGTRWFRCLKFGDGRESACIIDFLEDYLVWQAQITRMDVGPK